MITSINHNIDTVNPRKTGLFISRSTEAIWYIDKNGTGVCVRSGSHWKVNEIYPGDITKHIPGILLPYETSLGL